MAIPNPTEKIKNSSALRDATERLSTVRDQAQDFMHDTSDNVTQMYDQTVSWVQKNPGKTIALVSTVAAMGYLFYMMSREESSQGVFSHKS